MAVRCAAVVSNTRWTNVWEARGGDAEALDLLCAKYRPVVLAYLRRRGLGDDAEDLAQEAMIGLLAALDDLDPSAGSFRALVQSISRNKLLYYLRERSAQARPGGPAPLVAEDADDGFDREWISALVDRCFDQLRAEQPALYQALHAVVVAGRTYAGLSAELGVSEGALRKRVMRGRRHLAGLVEQEIWCYGHAAADVDAEVKYLSGFLGPHLR